MLMLMAVLVVVLMIVPMSVFMVVFVFTLEKRKNVLYSLPTHPLIDSDWAINLVGFLILCVKKH